MKSKENCDEGRGWKMIVFKPEFRVGLFPTHWRGAFYDFTSLN